MESVGANLERDPITRAQRRWHRRAAVAFFAWIGVSILAAAGRGLVPSPLRAPVFAAYALWGFAAAAVVAFFGYYAVRGWGLKPSGPAWDRTTVWRPHRGALALGLALGGGGGLLAVTFAFVLVVLAH
jgi:hypothetical protein